MNQSNTYTLKQSPATGRVATQDNERTHRGVRTYLHDRARSLAEYIRTTQQMRRQVARRNAELRQQLVQAGLSNIDMLRSVTFNLGEILFSDESIANAVCGRTQDGTVMLLLLTNLRVVCVSQVPFFTDMDEFGYSTISGISANEGRWSATITLHAAIGEFTIRTMNLLGAKRFITAIQRLRIESQIMNQPALTLKY